MMILYSLPYYIDIFKSWWQKNFQIISISRKFCFVYIITYYHYWWGPHVGPHVSPHGSSFPYPDSGPKGLSCLETLLGSPETEMKHCRPPNFFWKWLIWKIFVLRNSMIYFLRVVQPLEYFSFAGTHRRTRRMPMSHQVLHFLCLY